MKQAKEIEKNSQRDGGGIISDISEEPLWKRFKKKMYFNNFRCNSKIKKEVN